MPSLNVKLRMLRMWSSNGTSLGLRSNRAKSTGSSAATPAHPWSSWTRSKPTAVNTPAKLQTSMALTAALPRSLSPVRPQWYLLIWHSTFMCVFERERIIYLFSLCLTLNHYGAVWNWWLVYKVDLVSRLEIHSFGSNFLMFKPTSMKLSLYR